MSEQKMTFKEVSEMARQHLETTEAARQKAAEEEMKRDPLYQFSVEISGLRTRLSEAQARAERAEGENAKLRWGLEQSPCSCLEGTLCARCTALSGFNVTVPPQRLKLMNELREGDNLRGPIVILPFKHAIIAPTETEQSIIQLYAKDRMENHPTDPRLDAATQDSPPSTPEPPAAAYTPKYKVGDKVREGPRTRTVTAVHTRYGVPALYNCDHVPYPWSETQLAPLEDAAPAQPPTAGEPSAKKAPTTTELLELFRSEPNPHHGINLVRNTVLNNAAELRKQQTPGGSPPAQHK